MLMIFAETLYKLSCSFVAFIGMDVLGRSAWSRKHTCFCVTSRWGVGLVWLVPVLVPGEAQGTISYRAEVHTELIIISFQNTLSLAPPLQAASATRAFTNSKIATQQQRWGSVFQTNSIRTLCTFPLILHDPPGSWRAQVLLWDLLAPPLWISACSLHTHTHT